MPTSHGVDMETATSRSNMTRASLKTTSCMPSSQSWNHKAGVRNPVPSDKKGIYIRSRMRWKSQVRFGSGVGEGDFPFDHNQSKLSGQNSNSMTVIAPWWPNTRGMLGSCLIGDYTYGGQLMKRDSSLISTPLKRFLRIMWNLNILGCPNCLLKFINMPSLI